MTKNGKTGENITMFLFDQAFLQVKIEIEKALTGSPHIIREYLSHLSHSQGKLIRARSVLVAAQDAEGLISEAAVLAAVAIEILHLASLVHDDVIDDADLRRGNTTVQKKYGKRTAVICGDYLLALSLKMLSRIEDKKEFHTSKFPDYVGRLCLGELNQYLNNHNTGLSVYGYLKIISGKTAALFEAAFFAGAVASEKNSMEIACYQKIGHCVGMMFQLMDDCLDFDNTIEQAKKPVQSDYENGVITLPLIHTFQQDAKLKLQADQGKLTREEINKSVEKSNGLGFTRFLMERFNTKAMRQIEKLNPSDQQRSDLTRILELASGKAI